MPIIGQKKTGYNRFLGLFGPFFEVVVFFTLFDAGGWRGCVFSHRCRPGGCFRACGGPTGPGRCPGGFFLGEKVWHRWGHGVWPVLFFYVLPSFNAPPPLHWTGAKGWVFLGQGFAGVFGGCRFALWETWCTKASFLGAAVFSSAE